MRHECLPVVALRLGGGNGERKVFANVWRGGASWAGVRAREKERTMETDTAVLIASNVEKDKDRRNPRGLFQKLPGKNSPWWIRYVDAQGRFRREKAGTKSAAIDLYRKRKNEALEGKKLPEK